MSPDASSSSIDDKLVQIIAASTITTIDDVIAVMRGLNNVLPNNDGLKWFNMLYLAVTEGIRRNPLASGIEDPVWLERLDVLFAKLYFSAITTQASTPGGEPRSWLPLINSRDRADIARVQFALAGMNAHINHDLPIALVQTGEALDIAPRHGTPQYRDFENVNTILESVEEEVKEFLATGVVGELDQDLGEIDDVIAIWSVRAARETAWANAEILWHLRSVPALNDAFLVSLDRIVGLGTQGLLAPVIG